jgi:uncharacterized damage-inducible protein DinB
MTHHTPNTLTVEFLHYNRWANLRLIDTISGLNEVQLSSSAPGAYGTVYDTLKHIVRAEASYYRLLTGTRLQPPFSWDERPSLSQIRPYAEQVSSTLIETAENMQMNDVVEEDVEGQIYRYKAVTLLIQVLNHGVEHRTNITTILAQQGLELPEIDGWGYMESNPDRLGA